MGVEQQVHVGQRRRDGARGFTLVELIAVIVVLSIIAGVALAKYVDVSTRARLAAYLAHANTMCQTLRQYEIDTDGASAGVYTITAANYQASGLSGRFMHEPLGAFGATWSYAHNAGQSVITATSLPSMGPFPSSGHEFMRLAAGENGAYSVIGPDQVVSSSDGSWTVTLQSDQTMTLTRRWYR